MELLNEISKARSCSLMKKSKKRTRISASADEVFRKFAITEKEMYLYDDQEQERFICNDLGCVGPKLRFTTPQVKIELTINHLDLLDGQTEYPWEEGEVGHVQTIMDYLCMKGQFANKHCSKCDAETAYVSRLHSVGDILYFDVATDNKAQCAYAKDFFFPKTLTVIGHRFVIISRYFSLT